MGTKGKALPTSWITWQENNTEDNNRNNKNTSFILDTELTIHIMNQKKADNEGININTLPKIKINVTGRQKEK